MLYAVGGTGAVWRLCGVAKRLLRARSDYGKVEPCNSKALRDTQSLTYLGVRKGCTVHHLQQPGAAWCHATHLRITEAPLPQLHLRQRRKLSAYRSNMQ